MDTTVWRLTGAELTQFVQGLIAAGKRVAAPVDEGGLRVFRRIESAEQVCLEPGKTRWSPKEFLFPRTETLFSYAVAGGDVRLEPGAVDETETVILGVRPCDAAGLGRLAAVFGKGEGDTLFAGRRDRTTIVSFACAEADPECFCAALGGGSAAEDGSDVQLIGLGSAWLVRPLTEKGRALTASLKGRATGSAEEQKQARERAQRVDDGMRGKPIAREWAKVLEASFDLPLWEALGQRCLGCSICTYVCPSCSCFDVQDSGNAWCGERCRSWDSCTFGLFTRHTTGHNPRATQAARFRQRVLHKFSYFPLANEGQFMCVGCGRCVKLCPVGMNVQETVQTVVAAQEGRDARS